MRKHFTRSAYADVILAAVRGGEKAVDLTQSEVLVQMCIAYFQPTTRGDCHPFRQGLSRFDRQPARRWPDRLWPVQIVPLDWTCMSRVPLEVASSKRLKRAVASCHGSQIFYPTG